MNEYRRDIAFAKLSQDYRVFVNNFNSDDYRKNEFMIMMLRRIQAFLDQYPTSALQILDLLKLQDKDNIGETFGMRIAQGGEDTTIQQYLFLLTDFLQKGVSAEAVLDLLKLQDFGGATMMTFMPTFHGAAIIQQYLFLLKKLMNEGVSAQSMLDLLQLHPNGCTIGISIAHHQNAATTQQYLSFLEKLIEKGASAEGA